MTGKRKIKPCSVFNQLNQNIEATCELINGKRSDIHVAKNPEELQLAQRYEELTSGERQELKECVHLTKHRLEMKRSRHLYALL